MTTGRICSLPFTRCLRLDRQFSPHADKHCLLAIDDHYDDAVTMATHKVRGTGCGAAGARNDSHNSQETKKARKIRAVLLPSAFACDSTLGNQVPPRGVEPLSSD